MLSENAIKPRFQEGGRGHYEVWYTTGNVPEEGIGWWIRTTLEQPLEGKPYAEQWFSVFDHHRGERWGLCERFPLSALEVEPPFALSLAGKTHLGLSHYQGRIQSPEEGGHRAAWDFSWLAENKAHLHLPDFAYTSEFVSTKVLAPTLDGRAQGYLELDGRRVEFKSAPMYQTHLWGKKHAERWVWAHCNAFGKHEGVSFEGLSVIVKKGGIALPPLTVVRLRTPALDVHMRDILEAPFQKTEFRGGFWRFEATQGKYRLKGELKAPENLLLRADYDDPDGDHSICNNCCVASGWVSVEQREGLFSFKELARYEAQDTFHMETGDRLPLAGVKAAIHKF